MRKLFGDLTGKKFNFITVIRKSTENQKDINKNIWICKCDCGKEIKVRAAQLIYGQKSCGCKIAIDLSNQRFGNLLVIKQLPKTYKSGSSLWLCQCDCGKQKAVQSHHLRQNRTTSCGCLRSKSYEEISGTYFGRIRNCAKDRNIEFNITIQEIWNLFIKQNRKCALSGINLCFASNTESSDGTASLDRIDSNKNYDIDNIQWVHKDINYMKQDLTDKEFIEYCKLIANYNS